MADITFTPTKRDNAMLKSLAKRYGTSVNQIAKSLLHVAIPNAAELLGREARLANEDAMREVPSDEDETG
jgi:hypothetical protein